MAGDREFRAKFTADTSDLERGANKAEGALKDVDDSTGNFGRNAALAGTAVVALGAGMWSLAEGAAEDEKAAAALATTLTNVTGATDAQVAAVEEWISAQGEALGIADDQLRPALDVLARGTKDVGEAQKLAALAMDVSAGTGKDLTAVSEALAKAYNGQLGPLKKLDPALADLVKSGASADEVFAALGQTFEGQAAKAAETTAGKMQIAQLRMAEMGETIGAAVIPIVTMLASVFLDHVIPAISSLVDFVGNNWQIITAAVAGLAIGVGTVLVPAFIAWATTAGAAAIATLAAAAPVIAVGLAVAALAAGLMYAWQHSETFRTIVLAVWEAIQTAVGVAVGYVKIQIDIWVAAAKTAWAIVETLAGIVTGAWSTISDAVSTAVGTVKSTVTGALEAISTAWSTTWSAVASFASDRWSDITGFVSGGVDSLVGFVTAIPGRIVDAVSGMFDAIPDGFRAAVNVVIDAWNALRIPGFTIGGFSIGPVDFPSYTWDGYNLPDIPRLHSGGIFDSGQGEGLALLKDGEGVFTPRQMAALGGGGRTYQITIVNEAGSDPAEAGRRVVDAIAAFEQRAGASWRAGSRAA